jgi:hypothetical protein
MISTCTFYETKFSSLNNLNSKEKKDIESKFPFTVTSNEVENIDICGQRIEQNDISMSTKFCPLCDSPMIVRMLISPCDHIICFSCSKPDSDSCYVCSNKILSIRRISDKMKLYECDFSDCFKFYESIEKLIHHRISHGIVGIMPGM